MKWKLRPLGALVGGEDEDIVVEAVDHDAAVAVVKGAEELAENVGGVGDGAAEQAGVEVVRRAGELEEHVDEAAQAVGDGGDAAGELVGVADDGDVGLEVVLVLLDEGGEVGAADFFFAFDEEGDVDGRAGVLLPG